MLAQFSKNCFVRNRWKILLDELSSVAAKHFCKVQWIQKRKNQIFAAEPLREVFLRGSCTIYG